TLLPDSSILTCGGSDGTQPLSSCELLNPISQEWDFVYPMNYTRSNHTATLLANGTVLIVGGKLNSSTAAINTAEIYYPDTYKFVETSPMASPRANHTATLLPDGNILVTAGGTMSGYSNTSEIYITTEAAWQTVSDNLTTGRSQHTATLLKNGNVMIIGGIKSGALNSTEIYNPITRTWNAGPALNMKRYDHTANLLKNGRVLVSGGSNGLEILKTAEIYNGVSWTYTLDFPTAGAGEDMNLRRENHTSTLLPNGKLLIAGGEEPSSAHGYLEGYNGDFNTWKEQGEMEPRVHHTTVLMSNGYLINIGGFDGANYLDSTEKNYFGSIPDSLGRETAIARQPLISTGTVTFDKGDRATLLSDTSSFHGITEASGGGGGAMNSSYHNPRVYIQQIDNPSGFLTDLTTSFYTVYDIQDANSDWGKTTSSITIIMPPSSNQIPYGFYNLWVANNAVFSNGFTVQVTSQRPVGIVADLVGAVVDETTINWSWDNGTIAVPPGNSDTYVVFSSSNNVFISTATLSDPGLFTQNGLTPNTMSSIKVAGSNLGGYGDFLKSSTYYTLAATPQNLTVNSASFETAELEWSPNSNSSITRYELSMSASNNAGDCFTTDISTPVVFNDNHVSTSATLNQLSANQFYCFRVRARNGSEILTTFSNNASTITVGNVNNLQGTAINIS
ncbi:MAG: fibronectin type III domain-containing protein, partial [Elusimicrobiales bacterium]|nr:fibronectin type III domain-containing protein [Elusimicrobiales bacterium]